MKLSSVISLYVLGICALIFIGVTVVLEHSVSMRKVAQAHKLTDILQDEMVRGIDDRYLSSPEPVSADTLAALLTRLKPYKQSQTFLIDKEGRLASTPDELRHTMPYYADLLCRIDEEVNDGHYQDTDISAGGVDYVVCYAPLKCSPLIVVTVTPLDQLLSAFRNLRKPLFAILLIGFSLLVIGVWFAIRYATRPLVKLAEAADSIGAGNFDVAIPDPGRYSDLARLSTAMTRMESSIKLYIEETARNARESERVKSELSIAASIQNAMLPDRLPQLDSLELASRLDPAYEVSGDLYDYALAPDGSIWFIVADVSGKGVPAALFMAMLHSLFHFAAGRKFSVAEMMADLNAELCRGNTRCMFITAIIGHFRPQTGVLTLVNAGHTSPLLHSEKEGWHYLRLTPGLPLGVMGEACYSETIIEAGSWDRLLLYTDGVTEAESSKGEFYGEQRLIRSLPADTPKRIVSAVVDAVNSFAGSQSDDITLLCVAPEARYARLSLDYDITEISHLEQFLKTDSLFDGLPANFIQRLNLVLEEILANIIRYSGVESRLAKIDILFERSTKKLTVRISDCGRPFNPLTDAPEVDVTLAASDRPVGGLGLFLVKNMTDDVIYSRGANNNNLTLTFNLQPT